MLQSIGSGVNSATINMAQDWSDVIRAAIKADGRSQAELARLAGLQRGQLSRFINGHRTLLLDSAAKLGGVLGLKLTDSTPKANKGATRGEAEASKGI